MQVEFQFPVHKGTVLANNNHIEGTCQDRGGEEGGSGGGLGTLISWVLSAEWEGVYWCVDI